MAGGCGETIKEYDCQHEATRKAHVKMPKKPLAAKALEASLFDCGCGKQCLQKVANNNDVIRGKEILENYMSSWYNMSKKEHRENFMGLLEGLCKGVSSGGHIQINLKLVFSPSHIHPVCPVAYAKAHCRGHTYYDSMIRKFKNGYINGENSYRKNESISPSLVKKLVTTGGRFGIVLDAEEITPLTLPSSLKAVYTAVWMHEFFRLTGDPMPNSNKGEIHLEKQDRKAIWKEYVGDFEYRGRAAMGYKSFLKLWNTSFSHVKIRAYKQVSGKCYICMILSHLRSKYRDAERRELINELHALHRSTYMAEREKYYQRQEKAERYPSDYHSDITDGMASNKTHVPHHGDSYDCSSPLNMHLQAVLNHGRRLSLFLSFNNLPCGANLANHCWLQALEDEYGAEGKIPDILYHQVDGGVENTAKSSLALCELMVARRLTRTIVLSRLPVGHTHEDIDAIFGMIWRALMVEKVITPQQYARVLVASVNNKEKVVHLREVWAIPDYDDYFDGYINPGLGRYAKGRWTQLQIIFEAVDISSDYPTGVKVSYRSFSSNTVKLLRKLPYADDPSSPHTSPLRDADIDAEIIQSMADGHFPGIVWDVESVENANDYVPATKNDCSVGYMPITLKVKTYPLPNSRPCHILTSLPTAGALKPLPVLFEFRSGLDRTVREVTRKFGIEYPHCRPSWQRFSENAPQTDNVYDYIREHPIHVPFARRLFGLTVGLAEEGTAGNEQEPLEVYQATIDELHSKYTGHFEEEVWVAQPSMDFGTTGPIRAEAPYIRVVNDGIRHLPNGEVDLDSCTPYYDGHGSDDVDDVSSVASSVDNCDSPRWCTVRSSEAGVRGYGKCSGYINRCFQYDKKKGKRGRKVELENFKIVAVVRNASVGDGELHFKIYDHIAHPEGPPDEPESYRYERCQSIMSTGNKNAYRLVPLEQKKPAAKRKRRQTWAYVLEADEEEEENEASGAIAEECTTSHTVAASHDTLPASPACALVPPVGPATPARSSHCFSDSDENDMEVDHNHQLFDAHSTRKGTQRSKRPLLKSVELSRRIVRRKCADRIAAIRRGENANDDYELTDSD